VGSQFNFAIPGSRPSGIGINFVALVLFVYLILENKRQIDRRNEEFAYHYTRPADPDRRLQVGIDRSERE
jgi:hypothetical protein